MNTHNRRHQRRAAKRRAIKKAWRTRDGREMPWSEVSSRHLANIVNWCARTAQGLETFSSIPKSSEITLARLVKDIPRKHLVARGRGEEVPTIDEAADALEYEKRLHDFRALRRHGLRAPKGWFGFTDEQRKAFAKGRATGLAWLDVQMSYRNLLDEIQY